MYFKGFLTGLALRESDRKCAIWLVFLRRQKVVLSKNRSYDVLIPQKRYINNYLLLIIFANSFDPYQAQRNVWPDLDPNCLTLIIFLKEFFKKVDLEKKSAYHKKAEKYKLLLAARYGPGCVFVNNTGEDQHLCNSQVGEYHINTC